MSKKQGPIERLWHGSLLILGSILALALALQVLGSIIGWLMVIAAIIALIAAVSFWLRRRRNDW
jgi:uncharacterized membrane protein YedE/YeeE